MFRRHSHFTLHGLTATILAGLAAFLIGAPASAAQDNTLYIFNWNEYLNPKIVDQFEAKYNVKVVQNYYASNAEMISKLRAGGTSQYDIVVPSNYQIPKMIHQGLLHKLDHDKIPNLKNLLPNFVNPPFDPGNQYTAAYQWGTTGLAYDASKIKNAPRSWGILFDPKVNPDYPFALIGGSGRDLFEAACAYLGHDFTTTNKDDWIEAAKLLIATKKRKNMTGFVDGTPALRQLSRGVISAGFAYNGDFRKSASEDPKTFKSLRYIIPKEGSELWVDNMAVPANAPHPDLAMKFINFVLEPKIGAELSNWTQYATPNKAARPMLSGAFKSHIINPTAEELKRLYFTPAISGEKEKTFNELWQQVQQAQ